ncbi:uncharacterized protein BCR38DRAFT_482721 [Pseudomassariella vexata]|uniref:VOC domain-containing protein n=1 Tax=Pseudomassariella vexata TaxID=1141098 RepID=A0A1Y2E6D2_9PEZI|nr:uncharacterized protein BCR38DRAFT_482721 [Pseudomassariella vexata]ORY67082.1 hypothetical protein BCR38DRAFT_482721 [Pseudomassariella vexata]
MLPYIQVSDLPSSASFYSAITQPLGLRYISASPTAIVFGTSSEDNAATPPLPVFEILGNKLVCAEAGSNSRIVLSAPSVAVVSDFHAAGLRANPDLQVIGGSIITGDATKGGETRAKITDFDGNIMEVVYAPSASYPSRHGAPAVRRTSVSTDEVGRILDWNLDVATSQAPSAVAGPEAPGESQPTALTSRRPGPVAVHSDSPEPYAVLRRSVTTSTIEASPRESSSGLTASVVLGSVLGAVAAGAAVGGALTYMNMRNERERAQRQEFEAPVIQRRSTFPDPYPDHRPRYVEVERTVEKIRYPEELPPPAPKSRYYPPPAYMARYSQVGGQSREVEELDDRSGRHSSRQSAAGRSRTRSEAGSSRHPLMIADAEYRSHAGSKHGGAPKMLTEAEHRSQAGSRYSKYSTPRSVRQPDAATYVSARTERLENTSKPAPQLLPLRSKAPSTYQSSAPVKVAPSRAPTHHTNATVRTAAPSRAPTHHTAATKMTAPSRHASARKVPLPQSHVGSSLVDYEFEEDNDSIAPSDSISCIGSRRSSRSHH